MLANPTPNMAVGAHPPRLQRKAQQRQRILEAARAVFFRDGFVTANLDEMARQAGVAKGTLYRYFASKAELYVAVLADNGERFERKMRDALGPDLSPAEQLRRMGRFYFQHWMKHRQYFQIFWALENEEVIGALPADVVAEVTCYWERCLRILADVIARGIQEGAFAHRDPWEVANILWTLANGLIQSEQARPRRELRRAALERVFENAVDLVLCGLSSSGAPHG